MSYKGKVLIIDDEKDIREGLSLAFTKEGYEVDLAGSRKEALSFLKRFEYDVIFLDIKLPDCEDLSFLKEILGMSLETEVIVISAHGDVKTAVEAIKLGAFDFLEKPFSIYQAKVALEKALEKKKLYLENIYLKMSLQEREEKIPFVGQSHKIKEILEKIKILAQTDSTILITGESGTGKGLLARKIHEYDTIYRGPFVAVDCGSIVPTLFESELFGHIKGAFTGATTNKIGKIELAQGGILFLDEIGNIPLDLQAKLLRVVEEKEFSPVGSLKIIKANVRIIAATNKNLEEEVKRGNFREDLYYRLNVVKLELPPLRERKEDIPLLASYFLNYFNKKYKKQIKGFAPEVIKVFLKYHWPGNVRELKHLIERLVIFTKDEEIKLKHLEFADFPYMRKLSFEAGIEPPPFPEGDINLKKVVEDLDPEKILPLEEIEKKYILKVLTLMKWNKSLAARKLGIDRKTLLFKLKKWNLA